MKMQLPPIALDETSFNVVLLHQVLEVLGFTVSQKEVVLRMAGADTREKVRGLQKQLDVIIDESTLVDRPTIAAIGNYMTQLGLTEASVSFTVNGTVRQQDGMVATPHTVMLFDLDLKGVGVYRTVTTLAEIATNGGFEFLGQTITDNQGNYSVTFFDWQYRRAERDKADVVAFAMEAGDFPGLPGGPPGLGVVGRSRLVNSEDYSNTGLVQGLDFTIASIDTRTEYKIVMDTLSEFLLESETNLPTIAVSQDQLSFTASELHLNPTFINLVAAAELLSGSSGVGRLHELLYGVGRQGIRLEWQVLLGIKDEVVSAAIEKSAAERIIEVVSEQEISAFLQFLHGNAAGAVLNLDSSNPNSLNAILSNALSTEAQKLSFISAVGSFDGSDFSEFWKTHLPRQPEFQHNPTLISKLLDLQRYTALTGNFQALVTELMNLNLTSIHELFDLSEKEWEAIIRRTGLPDFWQGNPDEEGIQEYSNLLQSLLNTSFPTQCIGKMVERFEVPFEVPEIITAISHFLRDNQDFDFATSRVHDFAQAIQATGPLHFEVTRSLMEMQRVFGVSTKPKVMATLLRENLKSAHTIANFPLKSFVSRYSSVLGGDCEAVAIYQRAMHISTRCQQLVGHLREYSHGVVPASALGTAEQGEVITLLETQIPNYSDLFGSPDICECEHCRSVYSPAAYFVDLLRFLWRGEPNQDVPTKTPLDILAVRRPDLLTLPLTCENTNTVIPYIDLANEVMEYYTANNSIDNFPGYDTGEASAEELRANPQNFNLEAYRNLILAKFPFTLPYHQPLDVIRTYSNHLGVSRYEAMKAINPLPNASTANAIAAESLHISQEEYTILTRKDFVGNDDQTALHLYFGFTLAADLDDMSKVREFLKRSGIAYTDLIELVKTTFINPFQSTVDFLQKIFSYATVNANTLYILLGQVASGGAPHPALLDALDAFNANNDPDITVAEFTSWVVAHYSEFQQVITLFEPTSKCDLDTTRLRTIQSIYEGLEDSGITEDSWSKIHRFIRLWRRLGWTIHETDLMLDALGESNIAPGTITKIESVLALRSATKLALNQLAVFWGSIDTYGDNSLYKKLFLNRAVQQIDDAFKADAFGGYLNDPAKVLIDHLPAIFAAFRMSQEDLNAILEIARVNDGGTPRQFDLATDALNVANLSTIYRYVLLAKTLKLGVGDLCNLISLFGATPFSLWDIQLEEFINITPVDTYEFYKLAKSVSTAGFKTPVLEYIFQGTLPADSPIGLDRAKALSSARDIRTAFSSFDQTHPDLAPTPLTSEIITAKLSLTFQPAIVSRFIGVLEGTSIFETITDNHLDVVIPDELSNKYTYVKGSGRLICVGVMSDAEKVTLNSLPDTNVNFKDAVARLYAAPEDFIGANFGSVFNNPTEAKIKLLDHPAQTTPTSLEEKLGYVYSNFIPILKSKLRRDNITEHLAALIGLTPAATSVLIAGDIESLVTDLSTEGFSASYFANSTWTPPAELLRVDATVDFVWNTGVPGPPVPSTNSSVRWEAYLSPPASGLYTLVVEVEQTDEVFKLYLDGNLILEKLAGGPVTSEIEIPLNGAGMHLLELKYADFNQNAGVHLRWKLATTELAIVPASVVYPFGILDAFVSKATVYHRAAKFIGGFKLSEIELNHFINYAADFGNINFQLLDAGDWRRIYDYSTLSKAIPQKRALLSDVFALANKLDTIFPTPTPAELAAMLVDLRAVLILASGWDAPSLEFLVNSHFHLGVDDFKNEISLNRLFEVMRIVGKTRLSAQTIAIWGDDETDFDNLNTTAGLLRNAVKAKYEADAWLDIAGGLSDTLRENQKQALIAYLLTRDAIRTWGANDADGLFEYFLIDVQMGACMDTSRIVQANSSVQMFVSRCLLNLESNVVGTLEKGVSPGAIDRDRWEWMKNYRVWEASRKVFHYPENYLEPEWRNDRSEFFKDLESFLVQNDITDRNVEQAFRGFLTSLNEVANLEVCGIHRENHDDGRLKCIHVIGRTHNAPYKFFYRTWNEYGKWTTWEKVSLDIRCVEEGDSSGVHLILAVWKHRLFLFWPEFIEVQEEPGNRTKSVEDLSTPPISSLESVKSWEIRLVWSEYVDKKWSAKQVSKEFIKRRIDTQTPTKSSIRWVYEIDKNQRLAIIPSCKIGERWLEFGAFYLSDITSKVEVSSSTRGLVKGWKDYLLSFMNYLKDGTLSPANDLYLGRAGRHKLLVTPTSPNYFPLLEDPFFFSDSRRTYFVRPVDINIRFQLHSTIETPPFMPVPALYDFQGTVVGSQSLNSLNVQGTDSIRPEFALDVSMPRSTNVSSPTVSTSTLTNCFRNALTFTQNSFDGNVLVRQYADGRLLTRVRKGKGLEFHTFYHPFSNQYVQNLNQLGLSYMMESDTEIGSDNGHTFESTYDPNFKNGFIQKPANFASRTYYKENVCFDVYGANSQYNWELFFHAPLYLAIRLSKDGRYEEAMKWFHYIFDPTTDEIPGPGESAVSRYWKVLPFKSTPASDLEDWLRSLSPNSDSKEENSIIGEYRDNPFDAYLIASNRPLAYMKHVVSKYVENLIAWGDSLFRQFTMESVNEALQIYVIANLIMGPLPEFVPKRGESKAETYDSLKDKLDDFSNALVELENLFPYSSETTVSRTSNGTSLLGAGSNLYFCIPSNEKLLDYWNTAADRLFKIRHCLDIDGVERHLALFSPPIDPALLVGAASQGLSIGSILADLSSPPPIYRFTYLIQKANEFCADVKALGGALLSALASKDAEELGNLRATQEVRMQELMTGIKERQVLDAKVSRENLVATRETAAFRLKHYVDLLGNETVTVPASPSISATLTVDSQLPPDTNISTIVPDVDQSLESSTEAGVKLIPRELAELKKSKEAMVFQTVGSGMEAIAGIVNLIPNFEGAAKPFGVGLSTTLGGTNLGAAFSALAKIPQITSSILSFESTQAAKMASYIRREQDWTLQANLAAREITQLDKQITSADIKVQVTQKELENHKQQIEDSKAVELFLLEKFTNLELYQWMKEQLFAVYKSSYNLAYDMAKKAEKAYKFEIGDELTSFIGYGYWDNSKQGLVAGDKLQFALRQLEKSYLEQNRRELELSKSISLARLNPLALIELRETGSCEVSVPEEWFDLDFRGHYFRRLKAARITIPCVVGPYSSVSCTLRLMSNSVRINTMLTGSGAFPYAHENDDGVPIDDDRFRTNLTPVNAIATSLAQNDSGMFEFNFRDERFLPFERAGAISKWQIELSTEPELRQFDYSTISDVILHLDYTAREDAGPFKLAATDYIKGFLNPEDEDAVPLMQMFDMRHDYPTEWHRFLNPSGEDEHLLNFTLGPERFPFFTNEWDVVVMNVVVLARCGGTGNFDATLKYNSPAVPTTESTSQFIDTYDELRVASFATSDPLVNLAAQMTVTIDASEIEDLYLVIQYRLAVP